MPKTTKYSVCTICDIGCQVRTEAEDGVVKRVVAHDHPVLAKNICFKGVAAPSIHNHPDRLRKPLKRVGERGADQWEEISYEQAMDEIAEKLKGRCKQTRTRSIRGFHIGLEHPDHARYRSPVHEPLRFAQLDKRCVALCRKHCGS